MSLSCTEPSLSPHLDICLQQWKFIEIEKKCRMHSELMRNFSKFTFRFDLVYNKKGNNYFIFLLLLGLQFTIISLFYTPSVSVYFLKAVPACVLLCLPSLCSRAAEQQQRQQLQTHLQRSSNFPPREHFPLQPFHGEEQTRTHLFLRQPYVHKVPKNWQGKQTCTKKTKLLSR